MHLKKLSLLAIITTFILIIWGAVVHNTESSLACPDWPLCYNQFFPEMKGSILIEHGHRLLASFVGLLTLLILFFSYKNYKNLKNEFNAKILKFSLLALFFVLIQGLLGGITVALRLPTIVSTSHLGLSLIYLSTLIYLNHLLNEEELILNLNNQLKNFNHDNWNPLLGHGLFFSLILLYLQILLGAFMRHAGAGASCGLGFDSSFLCMDYQSMTLLFWPKMPQAMLHMLHRTFAIVVFGTSVYFSMKLVQFFKTSRKIRNIFLLPIFILLFQIIIGILTITFRISVVPTTLHLFGAALSLALMWKLNLSLKSYEKIYYNGNKNSIFSDFIDLTKPKLSLMVMVTAFVGTLLAPENINFFKGIFAFVLIAMVVTGAATINCYIEREIDSKMERTKNRPLASKRMNEKLALTFGILLIFISIPLIFIFVNGVTGILALIAAVFYLYIYTPMKLVGPSAVYVGAIPGALPPLMGVTAVTGKIDLLGTILFLILFIWQLPHFLAISIFHADDYNLANIKVYPNQKNGAEITSFAIFGFTLILFGISLLPIFFLNMTSLYTFAAILLGSIFLILSLKGPLFLLKKKQELQRWARWYFYASLFYLPLLLMSMIFFK